jgi:IS605 OrfB family transposase
VHVVGFAVELVQLGAEVPADVGRNFFAAGEDRVDMKLVVQVKLLPTPEQASALESTLRACNTAASEVAVAARESGVYRNYDLRKHVYQGIKDDHRLGAQAAQHVIKKVCDSYKTLAANIRAGNLGRPGSKRRRHAETNPISFRWEAAQPYDARMLSWQPRRRRKEARHAANVNHTIAKTIVTEAARTGRGIAVEDLTGIRDRVRLRKPERVTLSSWSFHQLGAFLSYEARRAGVPLVEVDPAHTSQTCHRCGHRDKRNRPDQETFLCRSCGVVAHADHNAALNIAQRGVEGWGAVNRPHAA